MAAKTTGLVVALHIQANAYGFANADEVAGGQVAVGQPSGRKACIAMLLFNLGPGAVIACLILRDYKAARLVIPVLAPTICGRARGTD